MTCGSNALSLRWLPRTADFRSRLSSLRKLSAATAEAWGEAVSLANTQLDFVQTNALDKAVQALFVEGPPPELGVNPIRLAILGSSTLAHLHAGIRVGALRRGLWVTTYENEYGQYLQEILDPDSQLHRFRPAFILFAFDSRHVTARVHAGLSVIEAEAELEDICGRIVACWDAARTAFQCTVLQQTVIPALPNLLGNNDHRLPGSRAHFINQLNVRLRDLAEAHRIDLVAVDQRVSRDGLSAWYDHALWYHAKQEIVVGAAPFYGDLVARLLAVKLGRSAKCLVLDLDNTIWGGVIGDDGLDGIVLGQGSALGEAFVSLQEYAVELSRRGVILAVCSKNDEANALEAFRSHPDMVLRTGHIASFMANWNDKAANLRAIAGELNIGLDALVFVDDSSHERALVRQELPMVSVPEVPDDPALVTQCLMDAGYFEAVAITDEDRKRTRQYQSNRARSQLKASATDLGAYLKGLETQLLWRPLDQAGLQRAAQLINKTNQFNLTTRRHTENDLRTILHDPTSFGLQLRLVDRFGDNGMIAVVLAKPHGREMLIDTWLMSCRVLGRQVEQATLNLIVAEARCIGARQLIGEYRPTKKNGLVRDHYAKLGFVPRGCDTEGNCLSCLDVSAFSPIPTYIETRKG